MFNTLVYGGEYGIKKDDFTAYLSAEKYTSDVTDSKFADGFGNETTWNLGVNNFSSNMSIGYKSLRLTGMYTDIKKMSSIIESQEILKELDNKDFELRFYEM